MTALSTLFTTEQQTSIEALCLHLTRRVRHPVTAEYGSTECGQHWAALGVDELPMGSFGRPGPLVSILTGAGVDGVAAVMALDGSAVEGGSGFAEVLQAAQGAAMVAWARLKH